MHLYQVLDTTVATIYVLDKHSCSRAVLNNLVHVLSKPLSLE